MLGVTDKTGYSAGWCIHYKAPPPGLDLRKPHVCGAGIDLVRFRGISFDRRPCFLDRKGQSKPGAIACESLRRPTSEEIADHLVCEEQLMKQYLKARQAIAPWRKKHRGHSFAETVSCPICKGSLQLTISGSNGHVHARCLTPDCIAWSE